MQLYFIRHAQSENNYFWSLGKASRIEDPEITELGYEQAEAVASYIKDGDPKVYLPPGEPRPTGFGLTHLYASLMVRSVQTGTIIAEALGLPLHGWEAIHECGGIYLDAQNGGDPVCLPGKNRAYFGEKFPGLVLPEDLPEAGWWNSRPVETREQWDARAQRFLGELLARHGGTDDRVGIVSHGGFYMAFTAAALKMARYNWSFTLYNTAISLFEFHQEKAENTGSSGEAQSEFTEKVNLVFHNRVDHLPGQLVT